MPAYKIVNSGGDNALSFDSYTRPASQGPALTLNVPTASSLIIETDAFIFSMAHGLSVANGIEITGSGAAWTVTINGFAGAFAGHGILIFDGPATGANKVTIGSAGALSGKTSALTFMGATTVTNAGVVWGETEGIVAAAAGTFTITNAAGGRIGADNGSAIRFSSSGTHTVSNSGVISSSPSATAILADDTLAQGIEKVTNTKSGTITAGIRLGGGADLLSNAGYLSGALELGSGNDTLTNSGTIDTGSASMLMGDDNDVVSNTGTIYTLALDTGSGNDKLTTTGKLFKTAANDWAMIEMGSGNDTLTGGAFTEWAEDGSGADKYTLGAGNDGFVAVGTASADATDTVDGGTGIDVYDASLNATGITLNLDTLAHGNDAATAFWYGPAKIAIATSGIGDSSGTDVVKGFENAIGSDGGDDLLFGSSLANVLSGGGGNDDLWGLAGNDTLWGGSGEDELFGGAGADLLSGGGSDGAEDIFHFLSKSESGLTVSTRDRISGFEQGTDRIHLDFDADSVTAGTQAFMVASFAGLASFSGGRGELRYVYAGPDTLVQVDTNGDRKADFALALTGLHLVLTAADFDLA